MPRGASWAVVLVLLVPACAPTVRGRIVDAATGAPLAGAVVRHRVTCEQGPSAQREVTEERSTDAHGEFSLPRTVSVPPACAVVAARSGLTVLAHGYLGARLDGDALPRLARGPLPLQRLRYRADRDTLLHIAGADAPAGSLWKAAVERLERAEAKSHYVINSFASAPGEQLGSVGVLAGGPPDAGDFLRGAASVLIVADDRIAGRTHAWTESGVVVDHGSPSDGRRIPVAAGPDGGWLLVERSGSLEGRPAGRGVLATPARAGGVESAVQVGDTLVTLEAGGTVLGVYGLAARGGDASRPPSFAISDLLPGADTPVRCLTRIEPSGDLVLIGQTATGAAVWRVAAAEIVKSSWTPARTAASFTGSKELLACAGGQESLYVATSDRGLAWLRLPEPMRGRPYPPSPIWQGSTYRFDVSALSHPFVALAVTRRAEQDVVYAVSGHTIHRFLTPLGPREVDGSRIWRPLTHDRVFEPED